MNRLLLLILLVTALCCPAIAAPNAHLQSVHDVPTAILDYSPAKWGAYTVAVSHNNPISFDLRIVDKSGHVVREVEGGELFKTYEIWLNNRKVPDLVVVASNGCNLYCLHTTYIFSQNRGIRNVAITTGGDGKFRVVGRHRLQYYMPYSGVLEYACDVCHACEPNLPLVLDWRNDKTYDVTSEFPDDSINTANGYRNTFLEIFGAWNRSQPEENIIAPAAGYYANEYETGHGPAAFRSIMRRLPNSDTRNWFRSCAHVIRYQIGQIKFMTTSSQTKFLRTPDVNVFTNPLPSQY